MIFRSNAIFSQRECEPFLLMESISKKSDYVPIYAINKIVDFLFINNLNDVNDTIANPNAMLVSSYPTMINRKKYIKLLSQLTYNDSHFDMSIFDHGKILTSIEMSENKYHMGQGTAIVSIGESFFPIFMLCIKRIRLDKVLREFSQISCGKIKLSEAVYINDSNTYVLLIDPLLDISATQYPIIRKAYVNNLKPQCIEKGIDIIEFTEWNSIFDKFKEPKIRNSKKVEMYRKISELITKEYRRKNNLEEEKIIKDEALSFFDEPSAR